MNGITAAFLAAVLCVVLVQIWLGWRNLIHLDAHRADVPPPLRNGFPPAVQQRATAYAAARTRLGMAAVTLEAAVLLAWTLGSGLRAMHDAWASVGLPGLVADAGVVTSVLVVTRVLLLPLDAWRTFRTERTFRLARAGAALFLRDSALRLAILAAVAAPLAAAALLVMGSGSAFWWLFLWAVWLVFVLLATWARPVVIAPLFNRFSALQDAGLAGRMEALLARCGMAPCQVVVADGSRRSSHGNAYVAGIGSGRRVVLSDTLFGLLDPPEIEAVVAHELGHLKRRHRAKYIAASALAAFPVFLAFGWLAQTAPLYAGLGVGMPSPDAALALFVLLWKTFGVVLFPARSYLLRRFEVEADRFAARYSDGSLLARALVKLQRLNLAPVSADPGYSAFFASHPPLLARIGRLRGATQRPRIARSAPVLSPASASRRAGMAFPDSPNL